MKKIFFIFVMMSSSVVMGNYHKEEPSCFDLYAIPVVSCLIGHQLCSIAECMAPGCAKACTSCGGVGCCLIGCSCYAAMKIIESKKANKPLVGHVAFINHQPQAK